MPASPRVLATWSATLKLPASQFPARPAVAAQTQYLKRCTDDLYSWQAANRPARNTFVLHDGPPYANGNLHIGHALNKILKDIICRFELSQGKRVHYVPGWDCHGLPIEIKALQLQKELGLGLQQNGEVGDHARLGPVAVREAARQLATRTIEEQKKGFKEWAVMGDWENAYKTMEKGFVLRQLGIFKQMVEKGLIYQQYKPVYWSPSSGTALAEAELEYDENHQSTAAFIKFPVTNLPQALSAQPGVDLSSLTAVIWTTTPWTLPANKAIAVHENLVYTIIEDARNTPGAQLLVAKDRLASVLESGGMSLSSFKTVVDNIKGKDLAGHTSYIHPLLGDKARDQPVLHADFVSATSGSGLVHMAPGHGMDDYLVCHKLGIPAFAPVDDQGCFTDEALPDDPKFLEGKNVQREGNLAVLDYLGPYVLASHPYTHKYPIDWRTKQPVIVRATEQWFANVEDIKGQTLQSLEEVHFIPESGKARLQSFIKGRTQWCVSRQRAWGVPIPALFRQVEKRMEAVMNRETVEHIMKVIEARGDDAWWTDAEDDPAWVPPGLAGTFVRGKDTMDVWFDSGTTWTGLAPRADDRPVADVYLEGTDQHRGWFQSSLLTHIAHQSNPRESDLDGKSSTPKAPYGTLITHGFTLDQDGRKMSKSLGNVISPDQITSGSLLPPMKPRKKGKNKTKSEEDKPIFDGIGADALRLWVASSDYTRDVIIGQPVLQAVNTNLHKYRVTFKWLLGVLDDFDPALASTQSENLIDQLASAQLARTSEAVRSVYREFAFFKAVNIINTYINQDLSSFYFETLKDRMYAAGDRDRKAAQSVLFKIFLELQHMLVPICPLLVEEIWEYTPAALKSVLQEPGKRVWNPLQVTNTGILDERNVMFSALDAVKIAQEAARAEKRMGSSLECSVVLCLPLPSSSPGKPTGVQFLLSLPKETLAEMFVVSQAEALLTAPADIEKLTAQAEWLFKAEFEVEGEEERGVAYVLSPKGEKCVRCWRYVAEEKGGVCVRCEDVLREKGVNGPRKTFDSLQA